MIPAQVRKGLASVAAMIGGVGVGGTADPVGESLAELQAPLPHGLVTDDDTAVRQHLLHPAQAERKAEVQLHSMADHRGGKPVAGIRVRRGRHHHPMDTLTTHQTPARGAKLTVPIGLT